MGTMQHQGTETCRMGDGWKDRLRVDTPFPAEPRIGSRSPASGEWFSRKTCPGPTIGMRDKHKVEQGEGPLHTMTAYAIEANAKARMPRWRASPCRSGLNRAR